MTRRYARGLWSRHSGKSVCRSAGDLATASPAADPERWKSDGEGRTCAGGGEPLGGLWVGLSSSGTYTRRKNARPSNYSSAKIESGGGQAIGRRGIAVV